MVNIHIKKFSGNFIDMEVIVKTCHTVEINRKVERTLKERQELNGFDDIVLIALFKMVFGRSRTFRERCLYSITALCFKTL